MPPPGVHSTARRTRSAPWRGGNVPPNRRLPGVVGVVVAPAEAIVSIRSFLGRSAYYPCMFSLTVSLNGVQSIRYRLSVHR